MTCIICCDDYTEKLRKPIKCPNCKKDVCLNCFKRHLLEDRNLHCMFPDCDKIFTFPEISILTGNIKFSNEIMDKVGLIALEEEKNFLPQRQKIAKRRLEEQKYELRRIERSKNKNEINKERYELENKLRKANREDPKLLEMDNKLRQLRIERDIYNRQLYNNLTKEIAPFLERTQKIDKEDREDRDQLGLIDKKENNYSFVKQCSFKSCKGFLENNINEKGWKCTLCDNFTCRKCHEPLVSTIDENDKKVKHQCDEDIVKNLKELKKDTKPCPKCGTAIFKISGCFSPDTKIPIYQQQYKLAKDIKVGDKLNGVDFSSRTVLEIFNGEDEMYLIKQNNALNYKVNSHHTLLLKNNNCHLRYFDHEQGFIVHYGINKNKDFLLESEIEEAYQFLEEKKNEIIKITVKEYLELDHITKKFLKGIKHNGILGKEILIDIEVEKLDKGEYFGFKIDKDHMFLSMDGTFLSNCSMMFCISCQTYFDWNTNKIHTRNLHNPDAVRWMREQGRAIGRSEGDGECTDPFINNYVYYNWLTRVGRPYLANNLKVYNTILDLVNYGTHISEVIVPRFADNYNRKSEELSVDYLIIEDYNDEKWTRDIRKFKKQQMFNNEFRNIITLLLEVMRTVLSNMREMVTRRDSIENIVKQLELIPQIALECNQKFENIKLCFNSKRKSQFHIDRTKKNKLFDLTYK